MTQLNGAGHVRPVIGGGALAAPTATKAEEDAPADAGSEFVASDRVKDGGIVVDRRPGIRTTLLMGGLGILAGGGMAIAASRLPQFALTSSFGAGSNRILQWGGIAAAGIGAVLTTIGLTQGADKIGYLAKVDGSRDDALARAAESQKDVGVVQIDDDSWGVVDLAGEDTAIDERGPGDIQMGKPPVPFAGFVSEYGDAFVKADGDWSNIGAPDRIAASSISERQLDQLIGAQVGVTAAGQRLVVGEPVDGKVHGQRVDAIRDSFERGAKNVAVVKVNGGYAAFALEGGDIATDTRARGFRIEPFDAVELLTADGLVGASSPAGEFSRVAMPFDDVSKIAADDAKSLSGRRIGSGQMRLGQHLGNFESTAKAGSELFEKNAGPVVLVQVDGAVAAFKVPRTFDSFDTLLGDARHVALLDSTTLLRPGTTGEATRDSRLPRVDVTKVPVADAASLEGRRIGTGNTSLGKLVKTYPSVEAAGADQFESGAPHRVVLRLADGAAVYESKRFDGFETLLGGTNGVYSLDQSNWRVPTDNDRELAGSGHVKVLDASQLAVGDAGKLVGKRFAMDGSKIVRVSGVASTHGSVAEAWRAAHDKGGDRYVVALRGGAAIINLDGDGTSVETGIQPFGNLSKVNGRYAFDTGGEGWSFNRRSVPFQLHEPIDFNIRVGSEQGRVARHLGSYSSRDAAYSSFDRSLRGGTFGVINADGPNGSWHVYELSGGGGSSWDERLGDAAAISELHHSYNDFYREGGGVGSETVYHVEERRTWRTRETDSGRTTTADTGIQRDESIDWGRTNSLRAQREREREEARRRAEEEARRREEAAKRAAEEAERRRQQQPSGSGGSGSSSGGGWGGGSGSNGNSNPGGGGGYDPGGGGAGSDW